MSQAQEARKAGDTDSAFDLYRRVYYDFPDDPLAVQALWDLATYKKSLAQLGRLSWEDVRDAYREYISFFPGAANIALAYFEVGEALYAMHYQREALSYFKLCAKRLPDKELAAEAESWQLKILIEIGRLSEAAKKIEELSHYDSPKVRLRAKVREAELLYLRKDYSGAMEIYHKLRAKNPEFYVEAPEGLRVFGQTELALGRTKRGREKLFYYLNLAEHLGNRAMVLFSMGESYWQERRFRSALKMYHRALSMGAPDSRPVILSRMRISQYLDSPGHQPVKWEVQHKLSDPAGDKPFTDVLDHFYDDPLAQDARLCLFRRFAARDDLDGMRDYGGNYLRIGELDKMSPEEIQEAGNLLMVLIEHLLKAKRYQELYDLYYSQHRYVVLFQNGRLLYLVGQALDAMSMEKQAALLYYRALKWPMTPEDKIELYYRRADLYLRMGDLGAADRLLKYLRKIYKGKRELGEIMTYSGRLREAQKRPKEALKFYRAAADIVTFPEKKAAYASDVIRLASVIDGSAAMKEIAYYRKEGLLRGVALQEWYGKTGDGFKKDGNCPEALTAYEAALGEGLPQDGKLAQKIHLHMGDCLAHAQRSEDARKQYSLAAAGPDNILKSLAQGRMNEDDISSQLQALKAR